MDLRYIMAITRKWCL